MATCTNCKAELTEGYDFCLACGMPVPTDVAVPDLDDGAQPEVLPPLPPQGATATPEPPPFIPPPPPAGQDAPAVFAAGAMPTSEERTWTIAAHISAFVSLVGIPPVIGPLVVWLMKKDSSPTIDAHGKEAVNFNLSFLLYGIVAFLLLFVRIGFILLPVVAIAWFVLVIVGTMKASNGEFYRYPVTIRFIK
ncbi:MAG: DUF4870 domain-containing protein [Acidimicrobiia bacterium]|nr:DUF4870 domain-containing protein [Acidimicrobiia bacterium]